MSGSFPVRKFRDDIGNTRYIINIVGFCQVIRSKILISFPLEISDVLDGDEIS